MLDDHKVDGMSGATMTANGVNRMLKAYVSYYQPYLEKVAKAKSTPKEMPTMDSVQMNVDTTNVVIDTASTEKTSMRRAESKNNIVSNFKLAK